MNDGFYLRFMDLPIPGRDVELGGQELILGECAAALWPLSTWFPFPDACQTLLDAYAQRAGVFSASLASDPPPAQAVYFGTPTIVDDAPLFPVEGHWTKEIERQTVRDLVAKCEEAGYKRIVSGLGSGDITLTERSEDMGPGTYLACMKQFSDFIDWVLVRDI